VPTRNPIVTLVVFALLVLFAETGCQGGGLNLKMVRSAAAKPSNVAVYFSVDQSDGTPVGGLKAEDFRIYEDDALISQYESKQTILNPKVAASHYTLLLVDMSGSISKSGQASSVVDAAEAFTDRLEKFQKVGVYAFDGSADLYPIVPFTSSGGAAKGGIKSLASFQPRDPSTNLHGAVVKGIELLKNELAHAEHPLKFGTLVVFTDGTDRAGRVSKDEMKKALDDADYDVFAIGLGAEISDKELGHIGKNGVAMAQDKDSVVKAFDQIAQKIESYTQRYYLLSYCTPARAGDHEVRVEAVVKSPDGKSEKTGSVRYKFKADHFTPDCDPNTPPSFDINAGDAAAPKEPPKEAKPKDEKPKPAAHPVGKPHAPSSAPAPSAPATPPSGGGADYNP
jgi:Mg-chelatase subunit ChlD